MTFWHRSVLFLVLSIGTLSSCFADTPHQQAVPNGRNETGSEVVGYLESPFIWIAVVGAMALASGMLAVIALRNQGGEGTTGIPAHTSSVSSSAPGPKRIEDRKASTNLPAPQKPHPQEIPFLQAKEEQPLDGRLEEIRKYFHGQLTDLRTEEDRERAALQKVAEGAMAKASTLETKMASYITPVELQRQNQEIDGKIQRLEKNLTDGMKQLAAHFQRNIKQTDERLTGDLLQTGVRFEEQIERLLTHLKNVDDKATELQKGINDRTLELQFETWKTTNLLPLAAKQAEESLTAFRNDEQNGTQRQAAMDKLSKLQERFSALAEAVRFSSPEFAELGEKAPEWKGRAEDFAKFSTRVLAFHDGLCNFLKQTDLDQLKPEQAAASISFADVVTGKSAEFLRDNYRHQLTQALSNMVQGAEQTEREWQEVRADLLAVLDVIYPAKSFQNFAAEERKVVQTFLEKLRPFRLQEISVKMDGSVFDPVLHEPIAERQCRPDLPENTVLDLQRRGYYMDSKVQRRALVSLSSKGAQDAVRASA